jgi:hypothetical protein
MNPGFNCDIASQRAPEVWDEDEDREVDGANCDKNSLAKRDDDSLHSCTSPRAILSGIGSLCEPLTRAEGS